MNKITTPTLVFNADHSAAIRLALGAALAHEATSSLSNRELSVRIGCGETTVRRYRRIANSIGLTGSISDRATPTIQRIPESMMAEAWMTLYDAFWATEAAASPLAKKIHSKAEALLTLLKQAPTKEEVAFIYEASLKLADEAVALECLTR